MKIKLKKIAAVLLSLSLLSNLPAVFAEEHIATRGEVVQALLIAADDYNPAVQKTDIIKGYEDGQLRVNRTVVNCDEFYKAFDIDENDGMYVSPQDRIKIW